MNMNQQVRRYLSEIGRLGGSVKSQAKTIAARENAKLGGWPKGRPRNGQHEKPSNK
jgi:hypothetical protein